VLEVEHLSKSFDGFAAVQDISLLIEPNQAHAIIGPNGAGKTTMMDVVTGKTRPDRGKVLFNGITDLTRMDEARIANLGIGRKFQKPTVFEHHTVFDNLELALAGGRDVFQSLLFKLSGTQADRIDEVMEIIALEEARFADARSLSHGQKQWLEIGMLLMQEPDLLLVDEPAAGMTDAETEQTAILLKRIAGDHSVVVVEHDMEFVRALDSRVTVLHEGRVLAEGSLEKVQNDETVIEVYLGR
jgi:urea transport system ATP-binding protein